MTVAEVLKEIAGENPKKPQRYSKKQFNKLMEAMANDMDFDELVAQIKSGEHVGDDAYTPAKRLRKWCRKVVEKAGIDKAESGIVESEDFKFDMDMEDLHAYFAACLYEFMAAGNKYQIIPKKDLVSNISIIPEDEKVKEVKARNPQTKEELPPYKQKTEKHRVAKASNKVPNYLKHRL